MRAGLARCCQRPPVFADFIGAQIIDIGLALFDQMDGIAIKSFKIVRGKAGLSIPFEAQPAHIFFDRVDIFLFFLDRIGVIKAQVTATTKFLGNAEIQADRFGMTDMQIAIGFRREAGDDLFDDAIGKIAADLVANKVMAVFFFACRCLNHIGHFYQSRSSTADVPPSSFEARDASRKASISPSRTPPVLLVSTPVRRSLTI